jgi:undecaprenyl diphosphate synthase
MNTLQHIAIIPDGNRRWAKLSHLPVSSGHKIGAKNIFEIVDAAIEFKIKYLTFFILSTENLIKRSQAELSFLYSYIKQYSKDHNINKLKERKIKLQFIGNTSYLKNEVARMIEKFNNSNNTDNDTVVLYLQLAIGYGSRQEIIDAVKKICSAVQEGAHSIDSINEKLFSEYLYYNIPFPDLLIRTGGESRISNFLLWQSAYSELYFSNKLWPDFKKIDLYNSISDYYSRHRRCGS